MAPLSILALAASSLLLLALRPPAALAQPREERELSSFTAADSPWLPTQTLALLSPNRAFAAGFRNYSDACTPSPGYVFAVWVRASADRTIVWSLPCGLPPVAASSPLVLSPAGALSLNSSSGRNLWPGNPRGRRGAGLKLLDDGQLVLGSWTSFDYPTNTFLPDQLFRGKNLTSRNGRYQFANATRLVSSGSDVYWDTPDDVPYSVLNSGGVLLKENEVSLIMSDVDESRLRRITLDPDGNLRAYSLHPESGGQWVIVWQAMHELCRIHGTCGPNSICYPDRSNPTTVTCVCPPGFREAGDGGCRRKLPDLRHSHFLRLDFVAFDVGVSPPAALTLAACQLRCLHDPGCVGFSYSFTGGQECRHHLGGASLANGFWSPSTEVATFLKVSAYEKDDATNYTGMEAAMETVCPAFDALPFPPKESKTTARNLAIIGTAFSLELLAGLLSFWAFLKRYSKYRDMARAFGLELLPAGGPKRFSYAELKAATVDFAHVIGQGGFGVVYKGELPDRRLVAVKRLKGGAITGSEADFWAEATIIARMHHLNLVRLWGFCAERQQRMLVYEYIPNGSLDKHIFPQPGEGTQDQQGGGKPLLDWGIRYRIAVGVARAIAYLHEECLEWVLHRDIKPENILLDGDFCPKVSDFGLAKLTKDDRVSRSGVRGTQGYLAPEWVMSREPITAKADVYSFGMVVLEMVAGVRSSQFRRSSVRSEEWLLPDFAYEKVYGERRVEDILDPRMLGGYDTRAHAAMVDRMVKTALWCLQGRPELRPSMGKVAKMLEGTVEITEPGRPTIFYLRDNRTGCREDISNQSPVP